MTESEIVQFIVKNEFKNCDPAIRIIYKDNYRLVESMILSNSGTVEDAKDIFQESVIAFYKNIKLKRYTHRGKIAAYLCVVAKNQWLKRLRSAGKRKTVELDKMEVEDFQPDQLNVMVYTEKQRLIGSLISKAGDRCKKLLQYVYYEKLKMNEIASLLNLASAQEARNQKLKCMRKLKAIVSASKFYQEGLKTN